MTCVRLSLDCMLSLAVTRLVRLLAVESWVHWSTWKKVRPAQTFKHLGESWDASPELFEKLEKFVCQMYVSSSSTRDVNKLYYHLFRTKWDLESSQLPQCKDCLHMHVLCTNYQSTIWRQCLEPYQPAVPDPKGHGWTTDDDGSLAIETMQGSPAPDTVLQLMSCKCASTCKHPDRTCLANQLKCTDMCKLQTCTNQRSEDEEEVQVELD